MLPEPTLVSVDWASAEDTRTAATAMAAKSLPMAMSFANELSRSAHLQMRALSRVAPEMLVKQFTAAEEIRGLPPLGSVEMAGWLYVEHICSLRLLKNPSLPMTERA
jgi:hypothetical protein